MKQPEPQLAPASHTRPAPQPVPAPSAGWLHVPEPLQESLVHELPSSGHATPAPLLETVHPPLPLHVELAWHAVGEHE
jgi:hypothetical protein